MAERIRIIGGIYRSRILVNPPFEKGVRPTQDRVREAVFSALGNRVEGAVVLDLFAGSGAYGFEAISRGAKFAYFNDSDYRCVSSIKKSEESLKTNKCKILFGDYKKVIHSSDLEHINLIFLDPPYNKDINCSILEELLNSKLVSDIFTVVAEQEKELEDIAGYELKKYSYSYKKVGIYTRRK